MPRAIVMRLCLGLLFSGLPGSTLSLQSAEPAGKPGSTAKREERMKATDAFFLGPIVHLEFKLSRESWDQLNRDNRSYVECAMIETRPDGTRKTFPQAAVKLKGALGSFQGPDEKPGLTVSLDQFKGAARFHGMDKFHLNNGAQDGSFLNEYLGGWWCRSAGVPASRCTHALVKWQGRELGLYVFKEAATKDFLSHFFENTEGSLYDGHVSNEIDADLEKQKGADPQDHRDRLALAAACQEGDPKVRWAKVAALLDVEAFLRVVVLENFTCHWDGYCFNRNNYRLYFDPKSGRAHFICHGMDQILGDSDWPILRQPEALVGQAVWSNPEWKAAYRRIAEHLYQTTLKAEDWESRVVRQGEKARAALAARHPDWAHDYQGEIQGARERVAARIESIGRQFADTAAPLTWDRGVAKLAARSWRAQGGGAAAKLSEDGQPCLHLRAEGEEPASWRCRVDLERGHYRFEARLKTLGVSGDGDSSGQGAGLRISGASRVGGNSLLGTKPWQTLTFEFESDGSEVVLVAELRALRGEVWFQLDRLQLVKLN